MRVPRKLKKKYKKLWYIRQGVKRYVVKSSIEFKGWEASNNERVWGCITRLKHDKI